MKEYEKMSLEGVWRFSLDDENKGEDYGWFNSYLNDTINLPGTTDEACKCEFSYEAPTSKLSRLYPFTGPAWYQRSLTIPEKWEDKYIELFLERTKKTRVWIDEKYAGECTKFGVPHIYNLSEYLTPGTHTVTVMVDNRPDYSIYPMSVFNSHQMTDETQTNWNGIIGKIELHAMDKIYIENARIVPKPSDRNVTVYLSVQNKTGEFAELKVRLASYIPSNSSDMSICLYGTGMESEETTLKLEYEMSSNILCWDEFNHVLYQMEIDLSAVAGELTYSHSMKVDFGMREFCSTGGRFLCNGNQVFLRGKNDACVFPLTGYPPMDVEGWRKMFRISKSYGINHYRFHSWCPPEAAFTAADLEGIYMQPEISLLGMQFEEPGDEGFNSNYENWVAETGESILTVYCNHPSFVMLSMGNEMGGRRSMMKRLIERFRALHPEMLYAQGSNNFFWDPSYAEGDDYWTTMRTKKVGGEVRASFGHSDLPLGYMQQKITPSTMHDFSQAAAGLPVPVISHETGQYQVYPDYDEIQKYTGVLHPRNLKIFQERLKKAGMLGQAKDFFNASGKLSAICYREDIESALRTDGLGGFQMLDLQDFPGQGTALVGMLDAFMDSKGIIEPEKWREFCSDMVLLARFEKYTWTSNEMFNARIEVFNYGKEDIVNGKIFAELYLDGQIAGSTVLEGVNARHGNLSSAGIIEIPLFCGDACRVELVLKLKGSNIKNSYPLWVYKPEVPISFYGDSVVTRNIEEAKKALSEGKNVLLFPLLGKIWNSIEGYFSSDFWCYSMFKKACIFKGVPYSPGTLGILCNPQHPALLNFPTEFHSNWQWWSIVTYSRPIILDNTKTCYKPIVQVIDNVERNHKLGLIFEAQVGNGRLLVCASDLPSHMDKPEVRQLMHSLLRYIESGDFHPEYEIDIDSILM